MQGHRTDCADAPSTDEFDARLAARQMLREEHNRLAGALMTMIDVVEEIQERTGDQTYKFPNLRKAVGTTLRESLYTRELALAGLGDEGVTDKMLDELERVAKEARAAIDIEQRGES